MSAPQAQYVLLVNHDDIEAIRKSLPEILVAQVVAHDIGLEKLNLIATPKPIQKDIPMPDSLQKAMDEAVELPVEEVIVPEEQPNE